MYIYIYIYISKCPAGKTRHRAFPPRIPLLSDRLAAPFSVAPSSPPRSFLALPALPLLIPQIEGEKVTSWTPKSLPKTVISLRTSFKNRPCKTHRKMVT